MEVFAIDAASTELFEALSIASLPDAERRMTGMTTASMTRRCTVG
jgi:hypothetical protein